MAQGRKTGGRTKGTPNRATAARQQEVAESGLTPLDFMLQVMRDEDKPEDFRLEAAKAAAPFVHPKLSAVTAEVSGPDGGPVPLQAIEWRVVDPGA